MSLQLKKGDRVRVRTGKYKGREERILDVIRDSGGRVSKVIVEHVNMMRRHTRATQKQQGGITEKEAPIDASNVMLIDPKTNQSTRFGAGKDDEGRKIRIARRSGSPV
jgi:large subunit ribosomal protein L24